MRRLLLMILVFTLSGNINNIFSWDSTAAKYLPLQVGNVWVYSGTATGYVYYSRYYYTCKITGTIDTLSKRYYLLQHKYTMISGTVICEILQLGYAVRIDSATMNIYKLHIYCFKQETLLDSLKSGVNDSAIICSLYNSSSVLVNNSTYNIFNNNFPSKKFTEFFGPGYSTVYASGIGIVNFSYSYQMNQCHDTLKGCIINGVLYGDTNTLVGFTQISSEVPELFSLSQNYPNPFNPSTKISFSIPLSRGVSEGRGVLTSLIVYDALGREVQTIVNENLSPGTYEVEFEGSNLPSGVYYYKLEVSDPWTPLKVTETKKMVLLK